MKTPAKIMVVSIIASTLTLSAFAFGGSPRDGMMQRGADGMPPQGMAQSRQEHTNPIGQLLREIDLDDTQISSLQELTETFKSEREALAENNNSREQDLADAINESGLDTALLMEREAEHAAARSALHADHLSQIIDILTADQRLELKGLLEEKANKSAVSFESLGY